MPGAGSNRINEFGFYTNYYTLPFTRKFVRKPPGKAAIKTDELQQPHRLVCISNFLSCLSLTDSDTLGDYLLNGEARIRTRCIVLKNDRKAILQMLATPAVRINVISFNPDHS